MPDSTVSEQDFRDILGATRDFVRSVVMPRELEIANGDRVPDDIRQQARQMGLFGYAIPQDWGGLGLDLVQDVEMAMEFGYTTLALRSMFGTNNGIAGQVLVGFGTDEQKGRWLEGIASGEVVASFALTEPGAGSNPAGLRTKAVRDDGSWVINGRKQYITNAPTADLFIVFARTRPADAAGAGIAVFLVPADAAGVTVGAKDAKMGQEGAWTSDVTFDDVRVGDDALIGGAEDIGYRAALTSLARGRIHIAALSVGTAQRALDESVGYAATATQGGTPIGQFQLVQAMLADMQTGVMAGRALVRDAARMWVDDVDRRIAPSTAKLFCTEMVGRVADLAVQVHGGAGYMRDVPVERIYRDVRLLRLYEGTSEIQRLRSGQIAHDRLHYRRRLGGVLDLDGDLRGCLHGTVEPVDRDDLTARSDLRADLDRRDEPHLVVAVVDGESHALDAVELMREVREQREREQAVRDRATERSVCRTIGIDVDPLVVVGGIGEQIHPILVDLHPVGGPELAAEGRRKLVQILEHLHALLLCRGPDEVTRPVLLIAARGTRAQWQWVPNLPRMSQLSPWECFHGGHVGRRR
jgi:acyl-CoA dehydrogenase